MGLECLKCGGTGVLVNGDPCPDCIGENAKLVPIVQDIPVQYQDIYLYQIFL